MRRVEDIDNNGKNNGADLSEYWRILWKKKYFVMIPVVLAGVITVIGVQFLKPVYKSAALVHLEDSNLMANELAEYVTVEEKRQMLDEETLQKIRAEITTSGFIDQVVARLGLDENPVAIERAKELRDSRYPDMPVEDILRRNLREVISNKIKVRLDGPGIYEIACYDYNANNCYLLANAVTTLFLDSQRQRQLKGLEEAGEFSDEQLQVYKQRLEQSEADLQDVQDRITALALQNNPVGESSKRYQEEFGGESNLRAAETIKAQLDVAINQTDEVIARTRKRIAEATDKQLNTGIFDRDASLHKALASLIAYRETQLRLELTARGAKSVDFDDTSGQVRETEQAIERQLTGIVESRFADVDADYRPLIVEYYLQTAIVRSLRAKRERLVSYIDAFKSKVDQMPQLEAQLEKLQDRVKTDRELYNSFLRAKTSSQIGQAMQKTNLGLSVDVLEPAAHPLKPERPKKKRILLLALIIGATLGTGGLLLSEYVDTSFRDVADIERRLELRVLGTVPQITDNPAWTNAPTRKQMAVWAGTAVVVVLLAVTGFYLYGRIADRIVISGSQQSQFEELDSIQDTGGAVEQ